MTRVLLCMYSLRLPVGTRPPVDGALGRLEMRWRQVGALRLLHCRFMFLTIAAVNG
jgi:hypothetical protein